MQKIISVIFLLLGLAFPAHAQTKAELCPYGYRHTLELSFSQPFGVGHVSGYDHGLSLKGDNEGDVGYMMRYSNFFTRHWGVFASFDFFSTQIDGYKYLECLDEYHPAYCHDIPEPSYPTNNDWYDMYAYGWMFGPTYRYDRGRWSYRARLGVGRVTFERHHDAQDFEFVRHDVAAAGPVDHDFFADHSFERIVLTNVDADHLGAHATRRHLTIEPSVQATFSVGEHFFVSVDVGYRIVCGSYYQRMTVTPVSYAVNPEPHFEPAGNSTTTYDRLRACDFLSLRLGLGWNIGWNRNERRR